MNKKKDLAFILLWPLFAAMFSFILPNYLLISTLLFFGIPAAYLTFRNPAPAKKLAIFSIIISVPVAIITDYIMHATGGWLLTKSAFPFKLFIYVSIEQLIWMFLFVYLVTYFYETFVEHHRQKFVVDRHLKFIAIPFLICLGIFSVLYIFNPALLHINFFYLKVGLIVGILPIILAFWKIPRVWTRVTIAGAYFFFMSFIYEITALQLDQWTFPVREQFIGWMDFGGTIQFPFEEFLFYIVLCAISILSIYEIFDDDEK